MTTQERIQEIKQKVVPILKKYKVSKASLFGSVLGNSFNEESDVDMLIEIPDSYGLIKFIEINNTLETELQRKVDLAEYDCVNKTIRKQVINNSLQILWKEE